MWVNLKPRRGLYKTAGLPRIGQPPRGLLLSCVLSDPAYYALALGGGLTKPASIGSSLLLVPTPYGPGIYPNGTTATVYAVGYQAKQVNFPFSIETLFIASSSMANRTICSFSDVAGGAAGLVDKVIGTNGSGQLYCYVFDGSVVNITDTTETFSDGQLVHAVATHNGTTLSVYVNGALKASGSSTGSYTGFSIPYFSLGTVGNGSGGTGTASGSVKNILLANLATACWTAAEVKGRAADPFGFLDYPDDDLFGMMVGATAGVVSRPYRIRWQA